MLKRKSIALLISMFGFATSYANATTQTNDNFFKPTIPNLHSRYGLEVNVSALALRPSASNLNYAIYNKALPLASPNWLEKELNPGYGAAFEIGIRYVLPCPGGNDINLNWMHLDSSTSASVAANGVDYFIGPDFQIGPNSAVVRSATGNVNFKYDVVNLDAGQYIGFGNTELRFFGGLSVGALREEIKSTFHGSILLPPNAGPFSMGSDLNSNFTGVGPRFGMAMNYQTDCGFGILGESAIAALIGSSHSSVRYHSTSVQIPFNNPQSIVDQNTTQVIPGIDAKVGVDYKHTFYRDFLFTVQAGYQGAVYINAINQYMPGTLVATSPIQTGGIFVATMNHTQSNYSVQGPFLKFALQF